MNSLIHVGLKIHRSGLKSDISCSIPYIDLHEWDGLTADGNFYNSYGWLTSLEDIHGPTDFLTVYGSSGLLAGCALWAGEPEGAMFNTKALFPSIPEQWGSSYLWGGARRSTHNEIVCTQGVSRQEALRHLFYSAKKHASEQKLAGFLVPYMPLKRALEIVKYIPETRALLHSAEAIMPVPKGGLAEMLSSWSSHERVRSKAEIAAFEKYGNRARWLPLTSDLDESVATLITNNRTKYGSDQDRQWMIKSIQGQRKSGVIHSAIAVFAERKDKIAAVTIFYKFGDSLHARYFGSDYTLADNDFRYFVLTYYLSLEYAVSHGLKKCCLSISALEAKAKRGSVIEPLATVVISCTTPLVAEVVENHNRIFCNDYERRFKSSLSTDWNLVVG